MSSVKYKDKSLEEVRSLVEKFREEYPDIPPLKAKLEELKIQKEQELFKRSFADLNLKNIADALKVLGELQKASEPNKKNKFFAKG